MGVHSGLSSGCDVARLDFRITRRGMPCKI